VSGEATRLAPNAKALIVAVPEPPDRSIRSPVPTEAPGLKLNPPAPAVTVLRAAGFVLPLSAVALLVYSGQGMTYYGIAHLVAIAVVVDLLVRWRRAARVEGASHVG